MRFEAVSSYGAHERDCYLLRGGGGGIRFMFRARYGSSLWSKLEVGGKPQTYLQQQHHGTLWRGAFRCPSLSDPDLHSQLSGVLGF